MSTIIPQKNSDGTSNEAWATLWERALAVMDVASWRRLLHQTDVVAIESFFATVVVNRGVAGVWSVMCTKAPQIYTAVLTYNAWILELTHAQAELLYTQALARYQEQERSKASVL